MARLHGVAWGGALWALVCDLAQPKWATLGAHFFQWQPKAVGGHMQQPNPPHKPLANMVCHLGGTPCNAPTNSGPNMPNGMASCQLAPPSFPKPWGAQGAATTIEKIKIKRIN